MTMNNTFRATPGPAAADGAQDLVAFREDVWLEDEGPDVRVFHRWGGCVVRAAGPGLRAALHRLVGEPSSVDELCDLAEGDDDGGSPAGTVPQSARLLWVLDELAFTVVRTQVAGVRALASLVPLSPRARLAAATVGDDDVVALSRFTVLRRRDGEAVLESPCALFRAVLHGRGPAAVAAALAGPARFADLAAGLSPDVGRDAVRSLVSRLVGAGLAQLADGGGTFPEDADPVLRQWEFPDLLFHSRSRLGRSDEQSGATFPFLGDLEPLPAVKPLPPGPAVDLPRPELEVLLARDPGLTAVLETRRSIRGRGERPLELAEVGELLYRAARVRALTGPDPDRMMPYQASDRPYPSGGASHDLELYLTVDRCAGLERACYYYAPGEHRLVRVNDDQRLVEALLQRAYLACAGAGVPDVLVTITSRFQRLSWKYQAIAYATTLKNTGALYQTLYLVATAMGLAPCGLGTGDADLAALAFGLEWAQESAVGEFMISRRPEPDPASAQARPVAGYVAVNDPQWPAELDRFLPRSR